MQVIAMVAIYVACLIWALITGSLQILLLFSIPLFVALAFFAVVLGAMAIEQALFNHKIRQTNRGAIMAQSKFYNDVPETRGTARNKGAYTQPTVRDLEDALRLAAFKATVEKEKEGAE